MTYNVMPHAVTALAFFIVIALFSVWSFCVADDGDQIPPALFSLVFSIIGIVVMMFAVVNG